MFQEPTFPRGGKLSKPKIELKDDKKAVKFGVRTDQVEKKFKPSKKQRKALKIQSTTEGLDDDDFAQSADRLNKFSIAEGMLIFGIVKTIAADHIDVALPGKILGRVPVSSVSNPYSKLVKNGEGIGLDKLFKRGQGVCTKVMTVEKNCISLSLNPSDLNGEKFHGLLQKGLVICGAVTDIEDHGFTIDLGIKNVRAFLPIEKSKNYKFQIGQIVNGVIDEVTISPTTSTVILKGTKGNDFGKLELGTNDPALDLITPGTIVPYNLSRILKNGLQGKIYDTFSAFVNENYLTDPLHRPNDYTIGLQFEARLLYVMPLTKNSYLSMDFSKPQFIGDDGVLPIGHIVEEAVSQGRSGSQIFFKINKNSKGVIRVKSIKAKYRGNYDEKTALMQYSKSTKHRLRIVDYDVVERLYICSDSEGVLNQKYFSINDVNVADVVEAKVKIVETSKKGYVVKVGNIRGYLYDFDCSSGVLKKGAITKCRILSIDQTRKNLQLTNRSELLRTKNVLAHINEALVDSIYTGIIVKVTDQLYLVRFFNKVRGIMYKNRTGLSELAAANLQEGVISNFRVTSISGDKIVLEAATDLDSTEHMGAVVKAKIECVYPTGAQIKVKKLNNLTGNVPVNYFTDFVGIAQEVFGAVKEGQKIKVANVMNQIFSIRDVDYYESGGRTAFDDVVVGDVLKSFVKSYENGIVTLSCPLKDFRGVLKLHINSILKNPLPDLSDFELLVDQPMFVRVEKKDENPSRNVIVSAKLEDVWNGKPDASVNLLQKYFKDTDLIKTSFEEKSRPLAAYKIGQQVKVKVKEYVKSHQVVILELPNEISAICRNVSKPYSPGQVLEGKILWIDYARQVVDVTINPQAMKQVNEDSQQNVSETFINEKTKYKGYVSLVRDDIIIVSIGENRPLVHICPRFHVNDFQPTMISNLSNYGKCQVELLQVVEGRLVGMFEENFKQCQEFMKIYDTKFPKSNSKRKLEESSEKSKNKKKKQKKETKKAEVGDEMLIDQMDGANDRKTLKKGSTHKKITKIKPIVVNVKNKKLLISTQELTKPLPRQPKNKQALPGVEGFWKNNKNVPDAAVSESEEETVGVTAKKPVKQLSKKSTPQSSMDFDRLLSADPDNVQLWLGYMEFHLSSGENEKAKGVGQRAIKTINFRKEKEKLQIWLKLLKNEIKFGTTDAFIKLFNEAVLCNNPLLVYSPTLLELVRAGKNTILVDLMAKMLKKYKQEKEMWYTAGEIYFALKEPAKAKEVLDKASKSLQPAAFTELTVRFALLSNKNHQKEYAQTLFEGLLTSHPARTDIWLRYAKMLIKDKLFDHVRIVFDRAIVQKVNANRIQTFYREYVDFEKSHGTPESLKRVQQMASEYVNKQS